jgi:hypothetical protein
MLGLMSPAGSELLPETAYEHVTQSFRSVKTRLARWAPDGFAESSRSNRGATSEASFVAVHDDKIP